MLIPSFICNIKDKTLTHVETCWPVLFISEQTFSPPFFLSFWKAHRNIFSLMSNGLSLQLLSFFPQTWSWSWASCCRSSRMWWRSWSPRLRAAAAHTSTSYRRPKAARGSGMTVAWRTRTAVSGGRDCGQDGVCVLLVGGAGVAVLGEAEGEPREGSWSHVISPSNCSVTLVICMELVLTRGHIPAQFAHDNTACVHGNELQLRITRLL